MSLGAGQGRKKTKKREHFLHHTVARCICGRDFFASRPFELAGSASVDRKSSRCIERNPPFLSPLPSTRAHTSEGPEPAYHNVVSGYDVYKHQTEPFRLKYENKSLPQFQLAYETWGKLNAKKNNAVLIFTGLSASSHAKSQEVGEDLSI